MALTNALVQVTSDLSLCKALNCGGAANRLKIKISNNREVEVYFATYVDSRNHFRGRCTWGAQGFDFDVWIARVQGAPIVLFKSLRPTIDKRYTEDALEVFFKRLNTTLTRKAHKKSGGGGFKAPQVEAHKTGTYKQLTTHHRVNLWVKKGVFDKDFGDFIKRHVNQGLRCKGK